ncbi:hypothetical protein Pla52o_11350 [Novipirellula galeiformis]|uniref:Isoprenylcysteine carboxyl methyltransferase (ICMT) family protein n=2 Tax=Novipirellula galeiformis TaxID=2528004 RepID=A0A5C6CMY5_9BACT|nr:hypothetical protein Pla52o_11350 [Novipirellula galeiformis]
MSDTIVRSHHLFLRHDLSSDGVDQRLRLVSGHSFDFFSALENKLAVKMDGMNARHIIAVYLVVQAVGTAAWWGLLLSMPASVKWFQPEAWPNNALLGFWLGDSLLLVGGSIATAIVVVKRTSWAAVAVWSLAAAVWYPALYCIGVSLLTDEAWIAAAMMVSMAGLTLAMATIHGNAAQSPATIRVTTMSKTTALCWTFAQTLLFWSLFLWILPKGIVELEDRMGLPAFTHSGQSAFSLVLFAFASAIGAWSGIAMAIHGDGTPLPTATASKLVVVGPYRFVRNPMALAGIMQGVAAGWYFGSYTVIGYALAGACVWHWFVRPVEESDLRARFGDNYGQYKLDVRLWVPTIPSPRGSEVNA